MNLERKIKRKIYAKNHGYFLITQPGLEDVLESEVKDLGYEVLKKVSGGIETEGKIKDLYYLSFHVRSASKIFLRLASFKALSLSKIGNKLKILNLELFWKKNTRFNVKVSCKKSRLYHSDMVRDYVIKKLEGGDFSYLNYSFDKKSRESLVIRIENDIVTVSLNATGDFLYKRNIKKLIHKAPIRENIAAALLLKYWNKEKILFDPMCGSGTFALEGAMIKNNIPPNFKGNFNFLNWVNFKEKTFNHIKSSFDLNFSVHGIFLSDIDEKAVKTALENLSLFNGISVKKNDFFKIKPFEKSGMLVMNLPYNKRIKVKGDFYFKIEKKIITDFKDWDYLILAPEFVKFNNLKKKNLRIKNGGFKINVYSNR